MGSERFHYDGKRGPGGGRRNRHGLLPLPKSSGSSAARPPCGGCLRVDQAIKVDRRDRDSVDAAIAEAGTPTSQPRTEAYIAAVDDEVDGGYVAALHRCTGMPLRRPTLRA